MNFLDFLNLNIQQRAAETLADQFRVGYHLGNNVRLLIDAAMSLWQKATYRQPAPFDLQGRRWAEECQEGV